MIKAVIQLVRGFDPGFWLSSGTRRGTALVK
jgi:hypothetical protein